jgi:hypothetical protein
VSTATVTPSRNPPQQPSGGIAGPRSGRRAGQKRAAGGGDPPSCKWSDGGVRARLSAVWWILRGVDVDWDRHADPPVHGTAPDPHLFWPWAVRAGREAAARVMAVPFWAPCVLCGKLVNLGAAAPEVSQANPHLPRP